MRSTPNGCAAAAVAAALIASGCGSSSRSSTPAPASETTSSASPAATSGNTATAATPASGAGALSGEAQSAATGDIPDNQVFLVFHDHGAGYSIKYPEGWTQQGNSRNVAFKDKNNLVHIVVSRGVPPSVASVAAQLTALTRTTPSLTFTAPQPIRIGAATAIKVKYTTKSAPNPVTGKRVTLMVDRYELARDGRLAVVDLGTPVGVDNVDAYRMMIQSFAWR
jgi:hypothetical protein